MADQTPLSVLRQARIKITDAAKGTQGALARQRDGRPVHAKNRLARTWCANGACDAVARDARRAKGARELLKEAVPDGETPVTVNDAGDHAAVLALFDRAIELAEARS